ncbi:MAG TPA: GGDEF domain-containing protein [Sphingomonas sp.]|nr:GGDEF domain-containing protein [Sphingomonas sp.]
MPYHPPQLTLAARVLIKAAGVTESWSALTLWLVCLLSLAIVLALDIATNSRVNLLILYLLVSALAGWSFGERRGLLFALLVAASGATARHIEHVVHPFPAVTMTTEIFNIIARLLSNGLIVVLVSGMRTAMQLERWRAATDGLTGALHKAAFLTGMATAIAAGREADRSFILCYMDLDGFKLVNDRYGHAVGDKILQIFAMGAVEAIRENDLFARMGGDEFVALLALPGGDDGDHVAAMVHARISDMLARTGLPVTCSMGALIMLASQVERLDVVIQHADALMYEVKRAGKNAVRVRRFESVLGPLVTDDFEIPAAAASSFPGAAAGSFPADRRAA